MFKGSWKTTQLGLLTIMGGVVRIGFAIKNGTVTEESVITTLTAMVGGVGLMLARDNNVTSEQVAAAKAKSNE